MLLVLISLENKALLSQTKDPISIL